MPKLRAGRPQGSPNHRDITVAELRELVLAYRAAVEAMVSLAYGSDAYRDADEQAEEAELTLLSGVFRFVNLEDS